MWASDGHAHSTTKWIGSNPSLALLVDVPATGLDSSLNPLAPCGRDSLAVEDEKRHLDIVPSRITTRSVYPEPPGALGRSRAALQTALPNPIGV